MTFTESPHALVELRALKEAGMQQQERELTYAIQKRLTQKAWAKEDSMTSKAEAAFRYVLFELSCDYGLSPGRPLRNLGRFIFFFFIIYLFAFRGKGSGAIQAIWVVEGKERREDVTPDFFFNRLQIRWANTGKGKLLRLACIPLISFYFSVLSAFHIGWRDLNVGSWITRMQPREFGLRGKGWVRTMSGLQSLISVYLIALWALTYFGRPFE